MIFKCIQCERDITTLRFHSAIAVMSGKYHIPAVRVTWSARTAASIFRQMCPLWSSHARTGRTRNDYPTGSTSARPRPC